VIRKIDAFVVFVIQDTDDCMCGVQGVVGLIVEAPFYGSRRPAGQKQWFLRELHHSFTQVYSIAFEAACLLHWAHHTWRLPLAVTGVSAGGAMAGLAAKFFNGPLAVVPYMGCTGPAEPFTEGAGPFQL
jgi:Alpha/beta hydrolase domain containing 18